MAQQDDELMFSIGVMERPDTKARLAAIAKSIEDVQKGITAGAVSIGDSVTSIKGSITGVVDQVRAFGSSAASSYSLVTASIAQLRSVSSQPIEQRVSVVVDSASDASKVATDSIAALQAQAEKPAKLNVEMPADLKAQFDELGSQIEDLRDKATEGVEVDFGLPPNLRNVFLQFSDVSIEAVDNIENALNKKIGSLAEPAKVATAQLRQEYAKRVADQSKAYAQMSEQMDRAVEKQSIATEMQGEAIKRAAHGAC